MSILAHITVIGADPDQVEYRLTGHHGCQPNGPTTRQFSYHTDGRERPLRWIGTGLADVGIKAGSDLTEDQFGLARELMKGNHPFTGEQLVAAKRAVPDDAKLPLSPLLRAIDGVAHEAGVPVTEVLRGNASLIAMYETAVRSVQRSGEAARLRADDAGKLADAAEVPVADIWGHDRYTQAAKNLWETWTDPADGTEKRRKRRVIVGNAGYDITLPMLPKSYSVLLAFAEPNLAAAIEQIYLRAAETVFGWLETHTAYGMRGKHGAGQRATTVPGNGFLGWVMVHRMARPISDNAIGDPHWHVHISIANMTRGTDGQWSTIAAGGRDLIRHSAAIDHMAKALIRNQLSQRYGIQFVRSTRTGAWEIDGIPEATLRLFSKRASQIRDTLTKLGYDPDTASRTEQLIAAQRSRGRKHDDVTAADDATLQQLWQLQETNAGRDPRDHMRHVLRNRPTTTESGAPTPTTVTPEPSREDPPSGQPRTGPAQAPPTPAVLSANEVALLLLDPKTGLTAHSRRFSRADALARVADAMPTGFGTEHDIEAMTDEVLATAHVIPLPTPSQGSDDKAEATGERQRGAGHMGNSALFTTADVVQAETTILHAAKASKPDQTTIRVTDHDLIRMAVTTVEAQQKYALSGEQQRALMRLVTTGRALDTVQGGPGTGKTTLMRAVRVVMESGGYIVRGAATAALAAQTLETESGIHSRTVASLVEAIRCHPETLTGIDMIVLDEANLTEDRDRASLYTWAATTQCRLVEIGDAHQLRGVGVGSLFGRVHEIVGGSELRDNRRQSYEDERDAIAAWREGRYAEAYTVWAGKGRLIATETTAEATNAMLARWWELRHGAPDPHREIRGLIMLAARNDHVRRLNDAAQAMCAAEGQLGPGRSYHLAGGDTLRVHVGDHIILRHNDRNGDLVDGTPVLNGYRGIIRAIAADGTATVEWEQPTADGIATHTAHLSTRYIAIGGLELGYAMTIHKSEGLTVKDQWTRPDGSRGGATVLFSAAGADNPAAHVATSRHRDAVYIFAGRDELETSQDTYLRGKPRTYAELLDRIVAALAEHARDTEEHGDDRPVVVDLGIEEFQTEAGREQLDRAVREAERQQAEQERAQQREAWHARARQRTQARADRQLARVAREAEDRRRTQIAAHLLRQTWQHAPTLVEQIIAASAFIAVARNLVDAIEAGYDAHEILAQIPLDVVGSPHIHDPAAFTAAMVDVAVERIRSGAADADAADAEHRRHAQQHREQMHDQAADILREAWAARPELAERVISADAFGALVRAMDRYAEAGLDIRDVLGSLSLAKIETGRDIPAYAVYSLHRAATRELDELTETRRRVAEQAAAHEQREGAAEVLRQAWQHAPEAAQRIIDGPAFRYLADRMESALGAGHDIETLLARLDPHALTLAPNPSGATVYAFSRQCDLAEQERVRAVEVESVDAGPHRDLQPQADPLMPHEPESVAPVADAELHPVAVPGGEPVPPEHPALQQETEHASAQAAPQWSARRYGHVSAAELRTLVDTAQRQEQLAAIQRASAALRAEQLHRAVAARQGPQVRAVEANLAQIREQLASVTKLNELETQWTSARDRAAEAARERALAEHTLDQLGRLSLRRAELSARIVHTQSVETEAQQEAARLAEQAAPLQQLTGPRDQRRHIEARANAAEQDHEHALEAAQRRDLAAAEAAQRHADRVAERHLQHATVLAETTAEQKLRSQLPPGVFEIEEQQRAAELERVTAGVAVSRPRISEIEHGGPELDIEPEPHLEPHLREIEIDGPELP